MTMDITYRVATQDDALAICALGQLLNAIHHKARPDIYTAATDDVERDLPHWSSSLGSPNQAVFIASQGRQAVGFITASLATASGPLMQPMVVARIGSVCVDERFWGNGIGRSLVRRVQQWAVDNKAEDLRLAVWAFNERATRLYAELGFETRALEMGMRLTR